LQPDHLELRRLAPSWDDPAPCPGRFTSARRRHGTWR